MPLKRRCVVPHLPENSMTNELLALNPAMTSAFSTPATC